MDPEKLPLPGQPTEMPQPHPFAPPAAEHPPSPTTVGYPATPPPYEEIPLGNTTSAFPPPTYPTGYPSHQPNVTYVPSQRPNVGYVPSQQNNVTYVNGAGQPVIMVSNACIDEKCARRRRMSKIVASLICFFLFNFIMLSWIWWW